MTTVQTRTFTPSSKAESAKECPGCRRHLPAKKFKGAKCKRENIEGIIRNTNCRECESKITIGRKLRIQTDHSNRIIRLEERIEEMESDFRAAIVFLRNDIDRLLVRVHNLENSPKQKDDN